MTKIFKFENVDCANCAAKIERNISKIKGIKDVNINFFSKKLMVDFDEERYDEIVDEIVNAGQKVEHDFKLVG